MMSKREQQDRAVAHLFGENYAERQVENYLIKRVKALGGEIRKVRWIGRRGAPDRLVGLPNKLHNGAHRPAHSFFIEVKAPGEKVAPHQQREHERMRAVGMRVEVVDSFERVDEVLA